MATIFGTECDLAQEDRLASAVDTAELMLLYAAEQGKDFEKDHIDTIIRVRNNLNSQNREEIEEAEFWDAYRNLRLAIEPVSRESLMDTAFETRDGVRTKSKADKAVSLYQVIRGCKIFCVNAPSRLQPVTTGGTDDHTRRLARLPDEGLQES